MRDFQSRGNVPLCLTRCRQRRVAALPLLCRRCFTLYVVSHRVALAGCTTAVESDPDYPTPVFRPSLHRYKSVVAAAPSLIAVPYAVMFHGKANDGWRWFSFPVFLSFCLSAYLPICVSLPLSVSLCLVHLRPSIAVCHTEDRPGPTSPIFTRFFKSKATGLWVYRRQWLPAPDRPVQGVVFLCHGFGEHCGRYEHMAVEMTRAGFAVMGMDHQGHGQSEGDRAYAERFSHLVEDVSVWACGRGGGGVLVSCSHCFHSVRPVGVAIREGRVREL